MPDDPYLHRERQAHRELGVTAVSRPVALFLGAAVLAVIAAVPLLQRVAGEGRAFSGLARRLPGVAATFEERGLFAANHQLLAAMHTFEDTLERRSVVVDTLLPPLQQLLTGGLGVGNTRVVLGRDGWLFFRPAVDHLTGPGFLQPDAQAARRKAAEAWQPLPHPDPLPAVLGFADQLAARGIRLLVVPAPVKAALVPERLSPRLPAPPRVPLANPDLGAFRRRLEAAGVGFLDPGPLLIDSEGGDPPFLATDTHWRPAAVEATAAALARRLEVELAGAPDPPAGYRRQAVRVEGSGDLVRMLDLPDGAGLFRPEAVTVHAVLTSRGAPWRPERDAEVLVLGDSFANVYGRGDLGWGSGAGLAAQLAFELQRPVDVVARNDGGAHGSRQALAAAGPGRLDGKRVVVWEFAARELSVGDWMPVILPREERRKVPVPEHGVIVTVRAAARVPPPGTSPYREAVTSLVVTLPDGSEVLVYAWGMRDGVLAPAADLQAGERRRVRLVPWSEVEDRYGTFQRLEPESPESLLLPAYWAERLETP